MHILVVNDDGPPSTHSSPYVHSLVRELQAAGHLVSVCLPDVQRSWIGKAHIIGQTIEPTYYRPPPLSLPPAGIAPVEGEADNAGTIHDRPYASTSPLSGKDDDADATDARPEEWVLINGTPASCVQIGLYHVFRERPPIDLVVSGPNYGRNTTAVFALSSGTLGGALEGATCNKPSIALSYAFFDRNHDRGIIAEASKHSVRVIEALYKQWPQDRSVDLYSVNVPLVAGVSTHKTVYAPILQNYWRGGGCFAAEDAPAHAAAAAATKTTTKTQTTDVEEDIRKAEEKAEEPAAASSISSTAHGPITHRHFKWQPQFTDVYKSVDEAPPGNDGWAVREGLTSITPLKANFWQAATELHKTEFQLDAPVPSLQGLSITAGPEYTSDEPLYALVAYEDAYVQPIILDALKALVPEDKLRLLAAAPGATLPTAEEPVSLKALLEDAGAQSPSSKVLQITPYEVIDFDYAATHSDAAMVNSYMIRKALIRKHFLAGTVDQWVAKRPASVLRAHVKRTDTFEVDYAEFLDDALVEAFDLRASLEANEAQAHARDRQWWILKPSMSDRGQGIRLFSTMDELQAIFDGWEEEDDEDDVGSDDDHNDAVAAADLRHFVAQPYIHPPLLLPGTDNRKFHIRVYVLCVGALQVYVHRDMLALFAAKPYAAPWEVAADGDADEDEEEEGIDLAAHLTNTCLQDEADKGDSVRRFWDLQAGQEEEEEKQTTAGLLDQLFDQICQVTGEIFEAAAVAAPIHFQALPHAFEVFGLDFLVSDDAGVGETGPTAWLLEVNAFPDFRQTGTGLQEVVARFWGDALRVVVRSMSGSGRGTTTEGTRLVLVKDVDLGRR